METIQRMRASPKSRVGSFRGRKGNSSNPKATGEDESRTASSAKANSAIVPAAATAALVGASVKVIASSQQRLPAVPKPSSSKSTPPVAAPKPGLSATQPAAKTTVPAPAAAPNRIRQNSSDNKSDKSGGRLMFESPRLELTDSQIFPSAGKQGKDKKASRLSDPEERWKALKEQAGSHQQDGSVLRVRPNIQTPQALKCGMPTQAAARVQELHVKVNGDDLPAWMDAIATTFVNLQHLHITSALQLGDNSEFLVPRQQPPLSATKRSGLAAKFRRTTSRLRRTTSAQQEMKEQQEEAEQAAEHSNRLKRLYILYRLPDLVSINGVRVSLAERRLARPDDPNGERVNRNEWVHSYHDNADIRISSLAEGEEGECVEMDVLQEDTTHATFDDAGSGSSGSTSMLPKMKKNLSTVTQVTHREKSVEVDLRGNMVEVDNLSGLYSRTPRRVDSASTGPAELEDESSAGSSRLLHPALRCGSMQTPFRCEPIVDTSIVGEDCGWTAACGLALFDRAPSMIPQPQDQLYEPTDDTLEAERVKRNFRRSSSWRNCQEVIAARAIAALPGARGGRMMSRIASRLEHAPSAAKQQVNKPPQGSKPPQPAPGSVVVVNKGKKAEEAPDSEMITRESLPRAPLFSRLRSAPSPRSPSMKQQPRASLTLGSPTAGKQPLSTTAAAAKERRSPFSPGSPLSPFSLQQFRSKIMAAEATTLKVSTAPSTQSSANSSSNDGSASSSPSGPVPPPTPKSSRARVSTPNINNDSVEAVEFDFNPQLSSSKSPSVNSTQVVVALEGNRSSKKKNVAAMARIRMKTPSPRKQNRRKKRLPLVDKLKEKHSARSTSIMDSDDEDEDDEENEGTGTPAESPTTLSAEEEKKEECA